MGVRMKDVRAGQVPLLLRVRRAALLAGDHDQHDDDGRDHKAQDRRGVGARLGHGCCRTSSGAFRRGTLGLIGLDDWLGVVDLVYGLASLDLLGIRERLDKRTVVGQVARREGLGLVAR